MPIEIPEGARTAGPVPPATPRPARGFWERWRAGRRPRGEGMWRKAPFTGTARGVGKLGGGLFKLGAYGARGVPGLLTGAGYPGVMHPMEDQPLPEDIGGLPIGGMSVEDPRAQSAYSGDPSRWMRPQTYEQYEDYIPDYDETFLTDLQSRYAQQDRAELEAKPFEDLTWWESSQRFLYRAQDSLKAALAGESTPEERKPAPVYDLSKTGEEKRTDTPIASSTTKALGSEIPVETTSSTDRILELIGTTGGGVDWKDTEKTYGMLAAMGILSDQGTGIASNFLGGVIDMARLRNDEKWRMTQLLTKPKVPWYPVLPRDGTYVLDTSGERPIVNRYSWEGPPGGGFGYSPVMPAAPANTADMIEYNEAKRLMREEGIAAAWAYKVGLGNVDTALGQVQPDIAIGAYLAPILYDLHRDMPNVKVVPSPGKIHEMAEALNGRTFEAAVAAGDIDREDWEMWLSIYGNFRPSLGMLK